MTPNPRDMALTLLWESQNPRTTLDNVLDRFEENLESLADPDRRLCHAIVLGVLRRRAFLDHVISSFSRIPFGHLDEQVVILLRIALFQMIFMDRIPDFAAIDSTIELAKTRGLKKASGFLNAVLRNAAGNHSRVRLPHEKNTAARLAVTHCFPPWLVKKWISVYGLDDTCILFNAINEIPPLTLRVNTLKTTRKTLKETLHSQEIHVESTRISPEGILLAHKYPKIREIPGFGQGLFQVQDEASQLVGRILDPRPGETVLDACTGLGTKAMHLAQLMENQGKVLGVDIGETKLVRLDQEAARLGITIVQTRPMDILLSSVRDFPGFFDRVLLDAPCSGLGVLRRNPDTKWKRTQNDVVRLGARQKKMLNAVANLVRPGGILVFSVCSCEKEENEDVINSFLNKRKDFCLDRNPDLSAGLSGIRNPDGFFKTYPGHSYMDGFFAARLVRIQKEVNG